MPLVFGREEIREYLAEMGYGEISDDDLEKFVKDLRKLIKKESRQRRRRRLGHTGLTRSDLSTTGESSSTRDSSGLEEGTSGSFTESETHPRLLRTPKSKLKMQRPRRVETSSDFPSSQGSVTSVTASTSNDEISRETSSSSRTSAKNSISSSSARSSDALRLRHTNVGQSDDQGDAGQKQRPEPSSVRPQPQQRQELAEVDENIEFEGESSTGTLSDTDLLYLMEHILKADLGETESQAETTAKRKFEIPMKIRRDPVALYHWYKTFWDRQKAPGEDRHMQLRWNVRAGTIGRFPCDANGNPIQYLPLNPIKSRKKIQACC